MRKFLGIAAAFIVLLGLAGALFIERLLPPEKVRVLVVEQAEKHLKRKVRLDEIKVGLVFGLRLTGVDVEGLASARQLTLRPSWRALLRRELDIQSVTVDGLKLTLPKTTGAPAGAGAAFAVRKAVLRDAEIAGDGWAVRDLDLEAAGLSPDKPFGLKASFELRGRRVSLEGTVDPAGRSADLRTAVDGLASGRVKGDQAALDFDLTTEALSPEQLAALGAKSPVGLPPTRAEGRVELRKEGPFFPKLALSNAWGAVDASGDIRRAKAVLRLSLPAIQALPPLKLEGAAALEGADVRLTGMNVGTPWGAARVDALLKDARAGRLMPDGSASFDLDLPAFKTERLPGYAFPAMKVSGRVAGTLERAKLEGVRLKLGGTDLQADGWVSRSRVELTLKGRSFVLEELTPIAPATRDLKLAGSGLFALVASGPPDRPLLAGKLQFKGLGAEVAGLALAGLSGTASFDERRIDVPNLRGTLDGSPLSVDLTVRDYARAPAVDLQAELDRLDLGKLLKAKAASGSEPSRPSSGNALKAGMKARGKLHIKELAHPNANARDARLAWELEGLAPGLKELTGWAKVSAGPGRLEDLGIIGAQSPILKIVLLPLTIIQQVSRLLGRSLLPDLNNIDFQEIAGDYSFVRGVMQVNDSRLHSNDLFVTTRGSINLPSEALELLVTAQVGNLPVEVGVGGTISSPKAKPKLGKAAVEAAKGLIEGLLRR